jgi:segregation and condensation protein B
MEDIEIKHFVESALLAAGRPLSVDKLQDLFDGRSAPEKSQIRQAIAALLEEYENRGITIGEVASGFRMQIKPGMADRLHKLWEEKPPRYSRALFETLALIAYRQPMTRGDIEEIRGVAVSANIIRSLMEREWIRVVGHRDVPGRPAMFGTTKVFLDYFGLKKLDDLPPLADLSDWESLRVQLNLPAVDEDELVVASAEVTNLSVDHSESGDETDEIDPELVIEDLADSDTGQFSEEDFEELVANEWPDPGRTSAVTLAVDNDLNEEDEAADDGNEDADEDADATASSA